MNRSLQEKSASRLAAAQLLYQRAITGEARSIEKMVEGYSEYADSKEAEPNKAFLKKLLQGIVEHGDALEPWVEKSLTGDWKKERMSPLLLAILRLAVFELAHFRETKPAIIINEYVSLSGRFFGDAETGFVNASLNKIAAEIRE